MKKLLAFMLMIFVAIAPLNAKDAVDAGNKINAKTASENQPKESPVLVSFGTNLSSFLGEKGKWQLGYNAGVIFNFRVSENLSMTLPISYIRINAAPENVEGRTHPIIPGKNIYKTFNDWYVSVVYIEAPLLFSYKFLTKDNYDIRYFLGAGLPIGIKDFSRIENSVRTDEILGVKEYTSFGTPHELKGGVNIITGVGFHVSRLYLDLLYAIYPYEVKDINKLNSISLRLGIDISRDKNPF